jgi:hypothetical protein
MIPIKDILPCPFCGAQVKDHPNPITSKEFFMVRHMNGCYFLKNNSSDFTLLLKNDYYIKSWNKRI